MPFYFSFFLLSNFYFFVVIPTFHHTYPPSPGTHAPRRRRHLRSCVLVCSCTPVAAEPTLHSVWGQIRPLPTLGHWCRWKLGEAAKRICFQSFTCETICKLHYYNILFPSGHFGFYEAGKASASAKRPAECGFTEAYGTPVCENELGKTKKKSVDKPAEPIHRPADDLIVCFPCS